MKPVEPIYTVELFLPLGRDLLAVLRSLPPEDWARPTICLPWTVKDVAAHLLGGSLGRLWNRDRPATPSEPAPRPYDELLKAIDRDNVRREALRSLRGSQPGS